MDYGEMLKKARQEMPESVFEKERFEIPKVSGHIQGNRTIISNFQQIADTLGRPVEHTLKFVLKAIGAPGAIKRDKLVIGSKMPASKINAAIRNYANEYVLCTECGKPDTKLQKEGSQLFLKCMACGAHYPVKGTM